MPRRLAESISREISNPGMNLMRDDATTSPEDNGMVDVKPSNKCDRAQLDIKLKSQLKLNWDDLKKLQFASLSTWCPKLTTPMIHYRLIEEATPVKLHPHRLNHRKRSYLKAEVDHKGKHGIMGTWNLIATEIQQACYSQSVRKLQCCSRPETCKSTHQGWPSSLPLVDVCIARVGHY